MPKKNQPSPHAAEIEPEQLDQLLRYKPSLTDCASFFKCSGRAIERFIRKNYDQTFLAYRDHQLSHTKIKLIQKALSMAYEGDTKMLIFSLKNLADWSDKHEVSGSIGVNSITDLLLEADQDILDVTPKKIGRKSAE